MDKKEQWQATITEFMLLAAIDLRAFKGALHIFDEWTPRWKREFARDFVLAVWADQQRIHSTARACEIILNYADLTSFESFANVFGAMPIIRKLKANPALDNFIKAWIQKCDMSF